MSDITDLVARTLCAYDETHDDHWYNLDTDAVATLIAAVVHPRHEPVVIAPGIYCLVCDVDWPCPRDDMRAELERERTQNLALREALMRVRPIAGGLQRFARSAGLNASLPLEVATTMDSLIHIAEEALVFYEGSTTNELQECCNATIVRIGPPAEMLQEADTMECSVCARRLIWRRGTWVVARAALSTQEAEA